jgi:hypothetical protein
MSQTAMNDRPADVAATTEVEQIHADHMTVKRLGHWTRASRYEVRARNGSVVIDLRSPQLPAEVEVQLRLDRAVVKLLLPDGATVEHWDLAWTGRGKVKDAQKDARAVVGAPAGSGTPAETKEGDAGTKAAARLETGGAEQPTEGVRRVRLTGSAEGSEVRVNRGGVAILAAMCSREYVEELRKVRKSGAYPTIDDPSRPTKAAA